MADKIEIVRLGSDDPDGVRARALWRRNLARAFALHPDVVSGEVLLAVLDAEQAFEYEARNSRGCVPSLHEAQSRGLDLSHEAAWLPEQHGTVRSI